MSSSAITRARFAAPISADVATAQLFPDKANPAVPVYINVPGTGRLEGKKFVVRASGSVTAGVAGNVTATLLMGKTLPSAAPFTVGNWTILGASAATALTLGTGNWQIEAELQFESVGGTLEGTFTSLIKNTLGAAAAITNTLTGLNGTSQAVIQGGSSVGAAEPVFVIAVALTFATANAGNTATLDDFTLDA